MGTQESWGKVRMEVSMQNRIKEVKRGIGMETIIRMDHRMEQLKRSANWDGN